MIENPQLTPLPQDTRVGTAQPLDLNHTHRQGTISVKIIWTLSLLILVTLSSVTYLVWSQTRKDQEVTAPEPTAPDIPHTLTTNPLSAATLSPQVQAQLTNCLQPEPDDITAISQQLRTSERSYVFQHNTPLPITSDSCGLAFIETSALDLSLLDHTYHLIAQDQTQETHFFAPLFAFGITAEMDAFLKDLGYKTTENDQLTCDQTCTEREVAYLETTSYDEPHVESVITLYQTLVRASFTQ